MKHRILLLLIVTVFASCEKWNDYTTDNDYTGVYIANQNQLRTIVANDPMSFELGVFMGGRRENTRDEWVKYRIAPELLSEKNFVGERQFELLPQEWYTLSNPNTFTIHKGSFLGTVTLTLNRDLFTANPKALTVNYAIPIKIYETSVDTILQGKYSAEGSIITHPKDYAVIVIKYINPFHGNYYLRGTQYKQVDGAYVEDQVYDIKDLNSNRVVELSTLGLQQLKSKHTGASVATEANKLGLKLAVSLDNSVSIEALPEATSITSVSNAIGSYEPSTRTLSLTYDYSTGNGDFRVVEQLIWRNTELSFEQW